MQRKQRRSNCEADLRLFSHMQIVVFFLVQPLNGNGGAAVKDFVT